MGRHVGLWIPKNFRRVSVLGTDVGVGGGWQTEATYDL